jgi:hypothetical protein
VEVLVLQAFVSLLLVAGSLLLFGHSARQRDYEHADRLALLPIERDDAQPAPTPTPTLAPAPAQDAPATEGSTEV